MLGVTESVPITFLHSSLCRSLILCFIHSGGLESFHGYTEDKDDAGNVRIDDYHKKNITIIQEPSSFGAITGLTIFQIRGYGMSGCPGFFLFQSGDSFVCGC